MQSIARAAAQSSAIAAWDVVRGGIVFYHIVVYFFGQPEVGTTRLQFAVPRAFTPETSPAARRSVGPAPSAKAAPVIQKNGVSIGT